MGSNIIELAKLGHELVVLLGNQHGMIDAASLVQRLTAQLDITAAALREKSKQCAQLAAENAALRSFGNKLDEMHNDLNGEGTGIQGRAEVACQQVALEAAMEEFDAIKTPATDAWQREQRQKAWAEGIYFTANRLLAAWEHGFIDSPDREVADVARMILGAVEMLPDATEGDFTREFSDEMLALIAKQLRNGEAL